MARPASLALPSDSIAVQIDNKAAWNEHRASIEADFYTVGYMRRGVQDLVDALQGAGVTTLVDIRQTPVSMYKPEFSKTNLQQYLVRHGLNYMHVPTLGVPRDVRGKAIGQPNRDAIWEWYDQYVVARFIGKNLNRFFNAVEHPVAFMCVELDPTACHRHRLAMALERHGLRGYDL